MKYCIQKNNRPIYLQLYRQVRDDIINGLYPFGVKLPSKRLLSEELGLSAVTVEHAYALLCEEGYAAGRERSGYFVVFKKQDGFAAASPPKPGPKAQFPAKSSGLEPKTPKPPAPNYPEFPLSVLSKTMRRVLTEYHSAILQKSPNSGCLELKIALKNYLARNRGITVLPQQIVIGAGAEYLYGLILQLLGQNRVYGLEFPAYEKIEQIYTAAGVTYERLPLGPDGIQTAALAATAATVLHTTPYRSFPSGVTATASKRHEYIRWAGSGGRFILESDYGSEFSVFAKPTETLFALSGKGNVIYLNTFSKTISPAMRMSYMVLPLQLVKPFEQKLGFYSCTVPTFEQLVLTELLESGSFERHINRVRRAKRSRLQNLPE